MREIKSIKTGVSLPVGEQPHLPDSLNTKNQEKTRINPSGCPWSPDEPVS